MINPLASPSAGAPALKYGDVNTVTPSPGEVKGLIILDLSNFNTSNVLYMNKMFQSCNNLKYLLFIYQILIQHMMILFCQLMKI